MITNTKSGKNSDDLDSLFDTRKTKRRNSIRKPDYLGLLPEVGYKFLEDMLAIWKENDNVPKRYRQKHEEVSRFHLELMIHFVFSYGFDELMEHYQKMNYYIHEIELNLCQKQAIN